MLKELAAIQRQWAKYMSELSEIASTAHWMDGLELALWKAINGQIEKYVRLKFTSKIIKDLKRLSQIINGWVIFDNKKEETFVTWEEWDKLNGVGHKIK